MEEDRELLDIVDEKDNIAGQDTKENKFIKELISRNVAIFVLDKNKKLLIVKRSPHKKSFPNKYDSWQLVAMSKLVRPTKKLLKEKLKKS